jgi:hypothetical protein
MSWLLSHVKLLLGRLPAPRGVSPVALAPKYTLLPPVEPDGLDMFCSSTSVLLAVPALSKIVPDIDCEPDPFTFCACNC